MECEYKSDRQSLRTSMLKNLEKEKPNIYINKG